MGGGHVFQSLNAGAVHSCGVTSDGAGYCWGWNRVGSLGDGTFDRSAPYNKPNPTEVTGGHTFEHVSAGNYHSCGLATSGAVYCWGHNAYGQLGDGTTTGYPDWGKASPVAVIGTNRFQSVSAGRWHSCGATTTNDAYCWGYNAYGQVGDGTISDRSAPEFVLDLDPPTP